MGEAETGWVGLRWWKAPVEVVPRVTRVLSIANRLPWGRTERIESEPWLLSRTETGAGMLRVGSLRSPWRERKPRTLVLLPPGSFFWEDTSNVQSPIQMTYILLQGGDLAGFRRFVPDGTRFAEFLDPDCLLKDLLHEMAVIGQNERERGFWQGHALLARVLHILATSAEPAGEASWLLRKTAPAATPSPPLLQAARDYFHQHLGEHVSVADIAKHLHMSVSSFAHGFTKLTGKTPMAAFNEVRMQAARDLLLHGVKLEIIARQTGFCDAFHFSKAFRRFHGVSPSRFRDTMHDAARDHYDHSRQ